VWLLPVLSPVARAASFIYYRITYAGDEVPQQGPVLLVANHSNTLLDPLLVVGAARRPVRFLAKASLFASSRTAWVMHAVGAVPLYRRHDEGTQMDRNADAFRAVSAALVSGGAVGIFPEGISHNAPAIAPLKTGAARIALGAAAQMGTPFPIIPIGIVMREKDIFGSEALAIRGPAVAWDDLALRGSDDVEAVRLLTNRIDDALRTVTVNLDAWEDRPLVECALQVWEVERGEPSTPAERVARLQITTRLLAGVRRRGDSEGARLATDLEAHRRRLQRFGVAPSDLTRDLRLSRGVVWAARRLHLLGPVQVVVAVLGTVLFWIPYRLTGWIVGRLPLNLDERSSGKLVVGVILYFTWVIGLAVAIGLRFGVLAGVASAVVVPVVGVLGQMVRVRWGNAWNDARRFFVLRSRRRMVQALRDKQRELSVRLDALYQASIAAETG
jgi:1-acyl-sn-glycerol-3-phosphate acyltransferase